MSEPYTLIRSRRRTLAVTVDSEGTVVVRAPRLCPREEIDRFVAAHGDWIADRRKKRLAQSLAAQAAGVLSEEELAALKIRGKAVFSERTAYFAGLLGVDYGRITVRAQKSRWGSCSREGNLSFNCLLLLAPPEVLDSVVVHELCHRRQMNHSARFYAEVYRVMPDYDRQAGWLKEHGGALQMRLPR